MGTPFQAVWYETQASQVVPKPRNHMPIATAGHDLSMSYLLRHTDRIGSQGTGFWSNEMSGPELLWAVPKGMSSAVGYRDSSSRQPAYVFSPALPPTCNLVVPQFPHL